MFLAFGVTYRYAVWVSSPPTRRTLGVDEAEPAEVALGKQVAALGIGQLLQTGVAHG